MITRTVILVITIMILAHFPVMAATDPLPPGIPILDETTNEPYEQPTDPLAFKGNIRRLSVGQASTFIGGGTLGAVIGNRLVGIIIGRYANTPDRVGFIMMGTMFGTILGGRWCEEGWWPC